MEKLKLNKSKSPLNQFRELNHQGEE